MPIRIPNSTIFILAIALLSAAPLVCAQPAAGAESGSADSPKPQVPPDGGSKGPDSNRPDKKRRSHVVMNPELDDIEALIREEAAHDAKAGAPEVTGGDNTDGPKAPRTAAPRPEIPDSHSVLEQAHRTRMEGKHTINRAVRLFKSKGQGGRWKDKLMTALIVGGGGLLALVGCIALMRRRH